MTIYLVKLIFTLYILVMDKDKYLQNINISGRLSLVLDQLESLSIFEPNSCGSRLKQTLKSVPENGSDEKEVPPNSY